MRTAGRTAYSLERPSIYYYRDKDGKEIDILLERDGRIYPIEIKLGAVPRKDWVKQFGVLDKMKKKIESGAVICLSKECIPITATVNALPAGVI